MTQPSPLPAHRLAEQISPYLRSQAQDPVAWYPWGEEALGRARSEDKPIFLSVGYTTCRWCHIMARETFRDAGVARLLNEHFVCIKVDRDERPDIDAIYMAATQIYSHGGGWPNSVFLTPKLAPYFCGTFFPLDDLGPEQPGFRHVVESMAHAWQHRRDDVEEQAGELELVMKRFLSERGAPGEMPGQDMVRRALDSLRERFDDEHGGFGHGAKFPMPANLLLLLELANRFPDADRMLSETLSAMAHGGVHDVLAGGFHRFATDREWRRPHFEKLLADNAWLLYLYARQGIRGDGSARRVSRRLADFLCRDLSAEDGAFYGAVDGETEGREGEVYLWSLGQLTEVLGEEHAAYLAPFLGYDGDPVMGQRYVLRWAPDLEAQAGRRRMTVEELQAEVEPHLERLLAARWLRPQPQLDPSILCDANGVAIAALAVASEALDDDSLLRRAQDAAHWVLQHLRGEDGTLRHVAAGGRSGHGAFLNDYAGLLWGLAHLAERDPDGAWLDEAESLAYQMVERLADDCGEHGGFWQAPVEASLPFRHKDIFDGAYPSSTALALLALVELHRRMSAAGAEEGRLDTLRRQIEGTLKSLAEPSREQVDSLRAMAVVVQRLRDLA